MRTPRRVKMATLIIGSAIVLVCLHHLTPQGLRTPMRVIGASMAETFRGPHYSIRCQDCRFRFAVDATAAPPPRTLACPNCGSQQAHNPLQPVALGDRLLIDRMSYQFRDPDRWEAILFQAWDPPLANCLKRVVGLPGETVNITAGDILIDGVRLKKDWSTIDGLAITVHDARFFSKQSYSPSRWRPRHRNQKTLWNEMKEPRCGFQYIPGSVSRQHAPPIDWIVYDHVDFHRGRLRVTNQVNDNYSYNQALSRKLYKTDDLILSAKVHWSGSGQLFFQLGQSRLGLDCMQGTAKISSAGQQIGAFSWKADSQRSPVWMEVATVDHQFFFVIDKQLIYSCDLDVERKTSSADTTGVCKTKWSRQLAVGSQSLRVGIEDLLVRRDIYYTSAIKGVAASRIGDCRLAADEFFVLGDNSPVSLDSRQPTPAAIVRRKDILGRAWRWR